MIRRFAINTSVLLLLIVISGLLYIRWAPIDGAAWHVDPLTVVKPDTPNAYLLRPHGGDGPAPEFSMNPNMLAFAVQEMAAELPRTEFIYGSTGMRHMTFVARSRWLGLPDFITVKVLENGDGSALAIYSRAQYGFSDLGVNRARVLRWVDVLKALDQVG